MHNKYAQFKVDWNVYMYIYMSRYRRVVKVTQCNESFIVIRCHSAQWPSTVSLLCHSVNLHLIAQIRLNDLNVTDMNVA